MVSVRERLEAFWSGERPDQIPYTIYQNEWRHTSDDPAWPPMFEEGLGVTWLMPSFRVQTKGVEFSEREYDVDGSHVCRRTQSTPVGEIWATWSDGWHKDYWLKTTEDYRVMAHIARNSRIEPDYMTFLARERDLPAHGVALLDIGRTPLQTILVDLAGAENFSWHLFEYEEEVRRLYDALLDNFRRITEIVAEGPGRYVSCLENFTAEILGPDRYDGLLMPVYKECFPILRGAGKIVGCHYDGRTACCSEQIGRAPIDVIESLTPPPEGDQTLVQARAAWPDKLFWSNINIACYDLPPSELRQLVLDRVAGAAPDGRKLAFEVSEQYPGNWRTSIPVVLQALKETRG
jgi:hypothetical protein